MFGVQQNLIPRLLWENPFYIVMENNGVHIHSIDDSTLAADSRIIERFLIKIFVENAIQMGNKFQNEIGTIPFVIFFFVFRHTSIRISIHSYLWQENGQRREEDPTRNRLGFFFVSIWSKKVPLPLLLPLL